MGANCPLLDHLDSSVDWVEQGNGGFAVRNEDFRCFQSVSSICVSVWCTCIYIPVLQVCSGGYLVTSILSTACASVTCAVGVMKRNTTRTNGKEQTYQHWCKFKWSAPVTWYTATTSEQNRTSTHVHTLEWPHWSSQYNLHNGTLSNHCMYGLHTQVALIAIPSRLHSSPAPPFSLHFYFLDLTWPRTTCLYCTAAIVLVSLSLTNERTHNYKFKFSVDYCLQNLSMQWKYMAIRVINHAWVPLIICTNTDTGVWNLHQLHLCDLQQRIGVEKRQG